MARDVAVDPATIDRIGAEVVAAITPASWWSRLRDRVGAPGFALVSAAAAITLLVLVTRERAPAGEAGSGVVAQAQRDQAAPRLAQAEGASAPRDDAADPRVQALLQQFELLEPDARDRVRAQTQRTRSGLRHELLRRTAGAPAQLAPPQASPRAESTSTAPATTPTTAPSAAARAKASAAPSADAPARAATELEEAAL